MDELWIKFPLKKMKHNANNTVRLPIIWCLLEQYNFQLYIFTQLLSMDYFSILELPEEIQALVVERVASNSFRDLYSLIASCKSMKALAEQSRIYHFYDVLSVP